MSVHITSLSEGMDADSPAHKLRQLPMRQWDSRVKGVTSIVVVPAVKRGGIHDSGYRCMDFAACHYGKAYCLLSGCSDVIHLGGICGYNNREWVNDKRVRRGNWLIDCLPNSGLLQIFSDGGLDVGAAVSSFKVFSTEDRPEQVNA